MMKQPLTALVLLMACLACPSLLPGHGDDPCPTSGTTVQLLEPPALSATAVSLQGDRLVASGAEIGGLDSPHEPDRLAGRVLVYLDEGTTLAWWATQVGSTMRRATPWLGGEGPGKKLLEVGGGERAAGEALRFAVPVEVILVFVDEKGAVSRRQTARVEELVVEW